MPLTSSVVERMMARFCNFYSLKRSRFSLNKAQCVLNRCKDLFKRIKYFGVSCTLSAQNIDTSIIMGFKYLCYICRCHVVSCGSASLF